MTAHRRQEYLDYVPPWEQRGLEALRSWAAVAFVAVLCLGLLAPAWPYTIPLWLLAMAGLAASIVIRGRRAAARAAELREVATFDVMTGRQFENAIAALLHRDGYTRIKVCGGAGDLGADVTALDPFGRRVVVQCKRYASHRKVGSTDVQRFMGTYVQVHRADIGLYVTTGGFTAPGRAVALRGAAPITLVDRAALAHWAAGNPLNGRT